jgi:hypothetical protein
MYAFRVSKLRMPAFVAECLLLAGVAPALGQPSGIEYFETKVRPIFIAKCHACHSLSSRMAGLDLSSAAGFQKGADSGAMVNGSDVSGSRLMRAISYENTIKMPPMGRLKDDEVAAIREWVRMGTPWPAGKAGDAGNAAPVKPRINLAEQRKFWSFQPVRKPAAPEVRDSEWRLNPIDAFLFARLEQVHLKPARPADKVTLLRRATYDLTGLPPTQSEIADFLNDSSAEAFARVVDRLLVSPRYGERWGRHWLDVARYADSTGVDEDHYYPYAWRYRDYVIEAFNQDARYDEFVREQIAGDMLPAARPNDLNVKGLIATGFLALGPKLIAEQDKVKMFYDIVDEQIDVVSRGILGLTIACARCHDHKFDPISTKDYYSLASIFASSKQLANVEAHISELHFAPLVPKDKADRYEAHQAKIKEKQSEINNLVADEEAHYRAALAPQLAGYMLAARRVYDDRVSAAEAAAERHLDAAVLERWVNYLKPVRERRVHLEAWYQAPAETREQVAAGYQARFIETAAVRQEAMTKWRHESRAAKAAGQEVPTAPKFPVGEDRFFTDVTAKHGPFALPEKHREESMRAQGRTRLAALEAELNALKTSSPPEPPLACALTEGKITEQRVFVRGNPENRGDLVTKRFPVVLSSSHEPAITQGSGRRELADWLANPANPLTARVMVNRIWQWHFGEGFVRTPSNFGKTGLRPTHPELLDYLAATFVERGWSIKSMHRLLMLSKAYQMSSTASPEARERDADNSLWSRFPRRRLEVEEIRDSLLALDGSLDLTMGGALQTFKIGKTGTDRMSFDPDKSNRRTVYLPLRRSNLPAILTLFDFGDATTSAEERAQTNVAPQALYMMNSDFVTRQAQGLARNLLAESALDDAGRVQKAYYRVIGRPAEETEINEAVEYIQQFPVEPGNGPERLLPWTTFCRALVGSNEFLYIR